LGGKGEEGRVEKKRNVRKRHRPKVEADEGVGTSSPPPTAPSGVEESAVRKEKKGNTMPYKFKHPKYPSAYPVGAPRRETTPGLLLGATPEQQSAWREVVAHRTNPHIDEMLNMTA